MNKITTPENILKISTFSILFAWILLISLSLSWGIHIVKNQTNEVVKNVARAYYEKDLSFRIWGTSHGGVYVPVSDKTIPNPYLSHVPERDITTPSGKKLTLMNPAFMIRQMMSDFSRQTGTTGHLTSLKLLNPINQPDSWEKTILKSFENKQTDEIISFQEYNGEPHLRLMKPFITHAKCLKCHASQGYKVGDIRGATTISIPLAPYTALEKTTITAIIFTHLIIFICGCLGIFFGAWRIRINIKKHLAMEQDIHRQYEFTKTIIDSLSHPFLVVDANTFEVIIANQAARLQGGMQGNTCYEISHGQNKPCQEPDHICPLQKVLKNKEMVMVEHLHYDSNNVAYSVEVQCFPIFDDNGEIHQVIEYSYDISDRKQAELEKRALINQLQQSQKMQALGTLAGGIAHDFNNILSGIIGYAQLSQMAVSKTSESWRYVDEILKASNRASDLVKQILTFTRKTTSSISSQPINVVIAEALNLLQASLPPSIKISSLIEDTQSSILIGSTQIHQIIMNLCTNAAHAMDVNGGILHIELNEISFEEKIIFNDTEIDSGKYLLLLVKDTGCGMDSETLKRIFDPFFTTKEIGKGTGMGLSVVQGIVKDAKGTIVVESELKKGTILKLYFPVAETNNAQQETHHDKSLIKGTETILYVDDETLLIEMQKHLLESCGYTIFTESDSVAALNFFKSDPDKFDLVITDQLMPHMCGSDLAQKILEIRPNIPIILCSADTSTIDENEAKKIGIKKFIFKPINQKQLTYAIRQIIDKNKSTIIK